jgi:hypothetical protein
MTNAADIEKELALASKDGFTPEAFIAGSTWVFAKTMPNNPHEYTVVRRTALRDDWFFHFVAYIRKHGFKARYGNNTYSYLVVGDWKYWTMGWPVRSTTLINRARTTDKDLKKSNAARQTEMDIA